MRVDGGGYAEYVRLATSPPAPHPSHRLDLLSRRPARLVALQTMHNAIGRTVR